MKECINCKKPTNNPKFCSVNCACVFTNRTTKRKRTKKCKDCENLIHQKNVRCKECRDKYLVEQDNKTLGEVIYTQHHRAAAFQLIRSKTTKIVRNLRWYKCRNCGYDKHIEVAHIQPIHSFPLNTPIPIINDVSNLIPLCPNCHWEFDHPKRNPRIFNKI